MDIDDLFNSIPPEFLDAIDSNGIAEDAAKITVLFAKYQAAYDLHDVPKEYLEENFQTALRSTEWKSKEVIDLVDKGLLTFEDLGFASKGKMPPLNAVERMQMENMMHDNGPALDAFKDALKIKKEYQAKVDVVSKTTFALVNEVTKTTVYTGTKNACYDEMGRIYDKKDFDVKDFNIYSAIETENGIKLGERVF